MSTAVDVLSVDDSNPLIEFDTLWQSNGTQQQWNKDGTYHMSNSPGSMFYIQFRGTETNLGVRLDENSGFSEIYGRLITNHSFGVRLQRS